MPGSSPVPLIGLCLLWLIPGSAWAATQAYTIDPGQSDLHWRVYRSGPLGRLGHNHVIAAHGLSGQVDLAPDGSARFNLAFPVSRLEVDNPVLRRRYGPDFDSGLSARDRAATRANMLGPALLNSARFGQIRLSGSASIPTGRGPHQLTIPADITIAGRRVRVLVPATVQRTGRGLRARGNFSLTHRQLGLRPFSAAMGALRVAERIDFTFDIQAQGPRPAHSRRE
ncbi:YceI family protein [Microbulbifer zhoushanensis]|uniref:YceI family protein n=1 Tax=Microbulbifer zhoushanensis TaxID=2904254 RepID=UPI001F347208|nr:YceI family protein [Microbulbifer zhoushanensis]